MLQSLRINELILMEETSLSFHAGLNILTGETGSGKTAIIEAIKLLSGEKTNISLIRKGASSCFVEAVFSIGKNKALLAFLHERGIDEGSELFLRRTIDKEGKSKAFVNHSRAPLSLLKEMRPYLLQITTQSSSDLLLTKEAQREALDLYFDLIALKNRFKSAFFALESKKKRVETLRVNKEASEQKMLFYQKAIDEIKSANLFEGEEERLIEELDEIERRKQSESTLSALKTIIDEEGGLTDRLKQMKHLLRDGAKKTAPLAEKEEELSTIQLLCNEFLFSLDTLIATIDCDEQREDAVSERLSFIAQCKRRYGKDIPSILSFLEEAEEKVASLIEESYELERLSTHIEQESRELDQLANNLSDARKKGALALEKELTREIQTLNMPSATLSIQLTQKERSAYGDEEVSFLFCPNQGEDKKPIETIASGGELSRLNLAIQTIFAEKRGTPILIFDEIDANIGGKTASIIGEKFQKMARCCQVIAITHFPQVARFADRHIKVNKEQEEDRVKSYAIKLDNLAIEEELNRMKGGV